MKTKITAVIALLAAALSYAVTGSEERVDAANISCKEAFELISRHKGDTNFVIIDFRPKEMYNKAYLENAFYYDYFSEGVDALLRALDKNKTYLIYCNVGKRSGLALEKMRKMGFKNVYHMYEGIPVWKELGYKTLSNKD